MRRFTAKIVFSGFVIACRRAICPTRRSPPSVKATTDGVMRLPSALVMTTGSPPSMMATQEFVVPRSIPMTLAICSLRFAFSRRRRLADRHERRAQEPIVQQVPTLMLVDDGVRRVRTLHMADRLVMRRIERPAEGLDDLHAVALERIGERPQRHVDAVGDRVDLARPARVLDRTVQVVDDRQQVAQKTLVREAQRLGLVAALATLEVLELGALTEPPVLEPGDLRAQPLDLRRRGFPACGPVLRSRAVATLVGLVGAWRLGLRPCGVVFRHVDLRSSQWVIRNYSGVRGS